MHDDPIEIVRTVTELRSRVRQRRARAVPGRHAIGLVPTMGALHEGHIALVRRAREACDTVVVSLFVNPTQFNQASDLDAYPRTEVADAALVADAGGDVLFAPSAAEVYPSGFGTTIDVGAIAQPLEGETRGPVHFRGVATVVAKLFNMVQPDIAFFGQKDAQQTLVIRQLVRDLDMPVVIEVCPTVRDPDGLALSSRNRRLSPGSRTKALGLIAALRAIESHFQAGERDARTLEAIGRTELASRGIADAHIDYLAVSDAASLGVVQRIDRPALAAVAVHVDGVRLIDNLVLDPSRAR